MGGKQRLQAFEDFVGDGLDLAAIGFDDQIRDFTIHGLAFVHKFVEDLLAITVLEQRPRAAFLRSRQLLFDGCVQIDNKASRTEMAAIVGTQNRAAAGCENYALDF